MTREITSQQIENQLNVSAPDRGQVIRDAIVIKIKLLLDGLRDLVLLPFVLIATLFGLLRHDKDPGRYLYRLMSYGKASEKWIGLFDDARKDQQGEVKFKSSSLDEILDKAHHTLESKYIDEEKKKQFLKRMNAALDELNIKLDPSKKTPK